MKKPSTAFWVLAVLFLLWNMFGCYAYILDQTMTDAAYTEAYGEAMTAVRDIYPTWSVVAYAVAVWGGLLAAILFLLKRRSAVVLFTLSLIAAVISFAWGISNEQARAAAGAMGWVMPLIVVSMGLLEIFYSRRARSKGYLR